MAWMVDALRAHIDHRGEVERAGDLEHSRLPDRWIPEDEEAVAERREGAGGAGRGWRRAAPGEGSGAQHETKGGGGGPQRKGLQPHAGRYTPCLRAGVQPKGRMGTSLWRRLSRADREGAAPHRRLRSPCPSPQWWAVALSDRTPATAATGLGDP